MTSDQLRKRLSLAIAPVAFGIFSACGGGGGGGIGIADGGIRGTGSSVGPVSGFGSVFVNGVKFETDGEVISNDGIEREDQLEEGMILRIDGDWRDDGSGDADTVEYDDTFRGPVSDVQQILDADGAVDAVTFTIYGQPLVVDKQTVTKRTTLATLTNGDFVRVSGWRQPDRVYRASFLGLFDGTENDVEIEGLIDADSLDTRLQQFSINGQLVSYDSALFTDDLGESDLAEGLLVEVEGSISGSDFIAENVNKGEVRRYRRGTGDDIEFAGPVNSAYSASARTFEINGLTVQVDNDTEFDDGLTESDLVPGLLIQVEGTFRSDGTVLAEEIEAREGNASVEGVVDVNTLDPANETFRVGGVLVKVTPLTIISDDDSDQRLKLADLNGSYELEVDGIERTSASGVVFLEAFRIERDDDDSEAGEELEFELTGELTEVSGTVFSILGIEIETSGAEFDDTSRDALEDALNAGQRPLLEIEYSGSASSDYIAEEIELAED